MISTFVKRNDNFLVLLSFIYYRACYSFIHIFSHCYCYYCNKKITKYIFTLYEKSEMMFPTFDHEIDTYVIKGMYNGLNEDRVLMHEFI